MIGDEVGCGRRSRASVRDGGVSHHLVSNRADRAAAIVTMNYPRNHLSFEYNYNATPGVNIPGPADSEVHRAKVSKSNSHPCRTRTIHRIIVSSDVLSSNRINVAEEKSDRVLWYKV